jgi:hypothetical protein
MRDRDPEAVGDLLKGLACEKEQEAACSKEIPGFFIHPCDPIQRFLIRIIAAEIASTGWGILPVLISPNAFESIAFDVPDTHR